MCVSMLHEYARYNEILIAQHFFINLKIKTLNIKIDHEPTVQTVLYIFLFNNLFVYTIH